MSEPYKVKTVEIGIYSFVELTSDPVTGQILSPTERMSNLMETIELAIKLDWMSLGLANTTAPISYPHRQSRY
jgi:hypothetical protein